MIKLNTNKEMVKEIKKALVDNDGYCPCVLDKTDDTKCICSSFRNQESGECHCGLYVKSK